MPSLADALRDYIAAAFPGLWIQSYEHDEALREIAQLATAEKWTLALWDIDQGLRIGTASASQATDPLAALRSLPSLAKADSSALLVLPNFHKFLGSPEILQCLSHQLQAGKQRRTFVVVLAPVVQIPLELEHQFVVLEHELPDRKQLQAIAQGIATEPGDLPEGAQLARLLDAAAGLTRSEAEGAFSLSLVRHGKLQPEAVWDLKTQSLRKSGLLTLHRGGEQFGELGGLESLKTFCLQALTPRPPEHSAKPRGLLLLGVPGTGKSQFCKALGNQIGRPTLVLDVGALMGSLVGQTEQNIRQALRIADAMAPCVVLLDEVEKSLSGVGSQADSGVSARLFGTFLTWLSDHTSDVFVVCTANDIAKLPPEFSRSERFDGIFFLDLPSAAEKASIWAIYQRFYALPPQDLPRTEDWTGAEIKSCCRLASLLEVSLVEAARQVVPVAVTAAESVDKLRTWASGRCLSASQPGLYLRVGSPSHASPASTRRITRSNN